MSAIIHGLEAVFGNLPLPLLEVWGRLAFIVGCALAISAFGGFTFRPGGRWGLGLERQAWDIRAVLSIALTFILIVAAGYIGSFIVLVPGAQTFESLKDLMVFLCIVLFGYPALLAVPFAYGLSDLIEGVPPGYLLDWLPGYFINPACFWIAYQLFGKNPDFRRAQTWMLYLLFVVVFMSMEPVLWGYICAGKFTSAISFGNITPALFFTTAITWIMAPLAMLVAFPLARKCGYFWAEIPGHVKERRLGRKEWVWEAGTGGTSPGLASQSQGWPIRMVILTPFVALVLLMVGATAYITLRSASDDAQKLATRLHEEISNNINLQLDEYLADKPNAGGAAVSWEGINTLLQGLPIAKHGVALVVNRAGDIIASSVTKNDPVAAKAVLRLRETSPSSVQLKEGFQFRFDHITEKPLAKEIWLARATAYEDRNGGHADWRVVTLMPESFYLAGVQTGNSRSAMIFSLALLLSLAVAAFLAALVTNPLRRISRATAALAQGDLDQHAPGSRMEELDTLACSFNDMAGRLKESFARLNDEIERRKLTEESLRMMQFSVDHAGDSIFWVNREGRILYANDAACAGRGYTREEMLGLKLFDVNPDFSPEKLEQTFQELQQRGTITRESHHRARDGTVFPVEVSTTYVSSGDQEFAFAAVRDIRERKRAEAATRDSEERYLGEKAIADTVINGLPGVFYMFDQTGRLLRWNDEFAGIAGITAETAGTYRLLDRIVEEDKAKVQPTVERALAQGQASVEAGVITPNGTRYFHFVARRLHVGENLCLIGSGYDITERRQNEERFRRLFEANMLGVMFWSTRGEIHEANDAYLRIVGYSREELAAGRVNWMEMTAPEYLERDEQALREVAATGVCQPFEKEYFRKDGTRVPVLVGGAMLNESPEEGVSFVLDLTERKKLEQQFQRAQRMESIGTLAGGIAHDLNNVLSPIMMSLELLQMKFTDPSSKELIEMIRSSAHHGADMVRQVLSFARGVEGRRMELQVSHLVRDIVKIANDTFLKSITLEPHLPQGLWTVLGDPTQLHQVLLNLCVNARDAMPSGGTLTIGAENITLDAHYAAMSPDAQPGPYVRVQVQDTGTGIPLEIIEKIFDPFFTTKEIGKGTGLGLSTTLGIVKSHGGFLRVYSEPGQGTTFQIHLPAQTEASAGVAEIVPEMPRGRGETVLVVDDEMVVREITRQTLEAFGYRVILANDGTEAVAAYARERSEIAVVLTDMMMPVMDGPATIEILRRMNPAVRIIGASGLSVSGQVARATSLGVKHFLPKPYTAETLLKVLQEELADTKMVRPDRVPR